ncbi:MAG: L-2-hydroxyglutarate oxidase [Planctomycetota bacterium]
MLMESEAANMFDAAVIGGGIVGLATAWRLTQIRPHWSVVVLEKETALAFHQTGRNSGVIHSGIYYKPGSLRAANCREGKQQLEEFCDQNGVAWKQTGKVIVATSNEQRPQLRAIYERGQQNGITCSLIDRSRLLELEPHCAGLEAIHVPEAGIVDYPGVCSRLGELIRRHGAGIRLGTRVISMRQKTDFVRLETSAGPCNARLVVNCGGLQSDRVARLSGQTFRERIVPFRGEYFELRPDVHHLCRTLIYPVPDPRFPFLGVHFTRMIHGGVECGPNAVLALAREGYRWSTINLKDIFESLTYPGFLRLARNHWRAGLGEVWRSLFKAAFVRALQKLVPEIRSSHLLTAPAGVRAQALGVDGKLLDDFMILRHERVINVCNAPSPAATASLRIGQHIAAIAADITWPETGRNHQTPRI